MRKGTKLKFKIQDKEVVMQVEDDLSLQELERLKDEMAKQGFDREPKFWWPD